MKQSTFQKILRILKKRGLVSLLLVVLAGTLLTLVDMLTVLLFGASVAATAGAAEGTVAEVIKFAKAWIKLEDDSKTVGLLWATCAAFIILRNVVAYCVSLLRLNVIHGLRKKLALRMLTGY